MRVPERRILHLVISWGLMAAGIISLLGLIGPGSPEPPGALAAPLAQNNAPATFLCKQQSRDLQPPAEATFHVQGTINGGFSQTDPRIAVSQDQRCALREFHNIAASFDRGSKVTITETAPAGFFIAGCIVASQGNDVALTQTLIPCEVVNGELTYLVPSASGGGAILIEVINSGPPTAT